MKNIQIIAPSGGIDPSLVQAATHRLQSWGFEVHISPHALGQYGRFSASPANRLADLNAALHSDADYILCARGGYGLAQIIDQIEIPQKDAPIIIGFSDITALHCLMGHVGRKSIHGAMCKALAADTEADNRSTEALRQLLLGAPLHYQLPSHPLNRQGEAQGYLRGGNLSILYSLQGSPFACPISKGDILFIEDVGEHPYAIDRMMHNLRLSGILSKIGGLIVGQFSDFEEDQRMPYSVYEGIRKIVEPYDYPIWFDFPSGHTDLNMPLLLNAPCQLQISASDSQLALARV